MPNKRKAWMGHLPAVHWYCNSRGQLRDMDMSLGPTPPYGHCLVPTPLYGHLSWANSTIMTSL